MLEGSWLESVAKKAVENGEIINDRWSSYEGGANDILDILTWIAKGTVTAIGFIGEYGDPIFLVVAICGFFLIMAGFKSMGNKFVGGSVLGYLLCKVCGVIDV